MVHSRDEQYFIPPKKLGYMYMRKVYESGGIMKTDGKGES